MIWSHTTRRGDSYKNNKEIVADVAAPSLSASARIYKTQDIMSHLQDRASTMSGEGDFVLRGVVKLLALFCRHFALLALCHLFSIQATRKSDILYAHSVVASRLALSL